MNILGNSGYSAIVWGGTGEKSDVWHFEVDKGKNFTKKLARELLDYANTAYQKEHIPFTCVAYDLTEYYHNGITYIPKGKVIKGHYDSETDRLQIYEDTILVFEY